MSRIHFIKKTKFAKLLSIMLCICLIAVSLPAAPAAADEISNTKDQIADLEAEKKSLDDELAALRDDEAKAVEYQQALQEKIDVLNQQIDATRKEIEALNKSISILEKKIEASEAEMQETIDLFHERVLALYKSGSTSELGSLEILLNSDSLAEFSIKSEAMKSVTKRDTQIREKLETFMAETETERAECTEQKDALAEYKKELDKNYAELDVLYAENEKALQAIQDKQAATQDAIAANEAESANLIGYLEGLIAQKAAEEEAARKAWEEQQNNGGGGGSVPPGTMFPDPGDTSFCWPMPGIYYVSQYYGGGHRGIDIAGPSGTPIVAAEDGQVIEANNYDSWGQSWGYYVLIYHNSTYTTRYAHLSGLAVGNGEYVSRGQVVGYEGSTGNSTGPHLHFEVYQNGSRIDPWPFIS